MPYVYKRRFLDTTYGIRKEGDLFKNGDSVVVVDTEGDITITFRGSDDLWELLKRKNVNRQHVTSDDLTTYKKLLLITNSHLEGYQPGHVINVTGGIRFAKSSPLLSRSSKTGVSNRPYAARERY